jgi:hypothetical protein
MKKLYTIALSLSASILTAQNLLPLSWQQFTVKDPQQSAGFIDVEDLNNDGIKEIVLSTLMEQGSLSSPWNTKGAVRIFYPNINNPISSSWTEQVVLSLSQNLPFCNHPQIMDVDLDGNKDILLQQGFLQTNGGSHQWIKGPAFSSLQPFATQTTHGNTYYFWHESEQVDLDNDGLLDIVTTSAKTQDASNQNNSNINPKLAKVEWYRNLGNGNFSYYTLNDSLGGVFLKMYDVDTDGDKDIVLSQFFWGTMRPALVWLENINVPSANNNYTGNWAYHVIDNTTGLGYHFEFFDIDADGADELVYSNHNNEDNQALVDNNNNPILPELCYFEIPQIPATVNQWQKTSIYKGFRTNLYDFGNPASQGTPGIFSIGDIDLNGMPDIVMPGDGNDTLYLFRQKTDNTWQKELLDNGKMFGHAKMVDIDGDGSLEIVAAKHNFPEIWQLLFPPAGFLKIYKPTNIFVSVKDAHIENNIQLFPNPVNDILTITAEQNIKRISVTDITGKIVYENLFSQPEVNTTINFSAFVAGSYIVKVIFPDGNFANKLLIKQQR